MDPKEIKYYAVHEAVEYALMLRGINYDVAHEYAIPAEKELWRQDGFRFRGDAKKPSRKIFYPEIINFSRSPSRMTGRL